MNQSASSPRPSPPLPMEERVAEGRERRRFDVQGFNARIYFGEFSPRSSPPLPIEERHRGTWFRQSINLIASMNRAGRALEFLFVPLRCGVLI